MLFRREKYALLEQAMSMMLQQGAPTLCRLPLVALRTLQSFAEFSLRMSG
jgi:hypothetical protein